MHKGSVHTSIDLGMNVDINISRNVDMYTYARTHTHNIYIGTKIDINI